MAGDKLDRRIQKTRKLLQDAMVELVSDKGFESVTIREITDRANVGHSTFYTHFQDKEELLQSCFEKIGELFEQHNQIISNGRAHGGFDAAHFFLNIFRFVEQNRQLFKALLGKKGIGIFNQPIYDYIFEYMYKASKLLAVHKQHFTFQPEMAAHFYVSAFIGTLRWWVDEDIPCSAEDIEALFEKLAMYGFQNI